MADVTKFPVEKVYPNTVKGREVWAQEEPPPEMVWAVCPWMRMHRDESRCNHCPRYEEDPDYGQMQRGCYGIAAEVCRVVFAMQKRLTASRQPNDSQMAVTPQSSAAGQAERNAMTKQEAEAFFARNPDALVRMRGLRDDGLLEKLDTFHPSWIFKTEEDALVNCVEAFRALGGS